MIDRAFPLFFAIALNLSSAAFGSDKGVVSSARDAEAILIVERTDSTLPIGQMALIALNGRPVGQLQSGEHLTLKVAPGKWRLTVQNRPTAEHSLLAIELSAGKEKWIRVELDPIRFPPERNGLGVINSLRQSIDAPNDDRRPLFILREVAQELPKSGR